MTNISKREQLAALIKKHPSWSITEYATEIGMSYDSVRVTMSQLGLSKNPRRGLPLKHPKKKSYYEKKPIAEKLEPKLSKRPESLPSVSSCATRSRSVGYLKLI